MANPMDIFGNPEYRSVFGVDPNGSSANFELDEKDAMSVATERLLPGDELVALVGDLLITYECRSAKPLGMQAANMTWTKDLRVKRKRRVKTQSKLLQQIALLMPAGADCVVTRCSGKSDLVEVGHSSGERTFIVGLEISAQPFGEDE